MQTQYRVRPLINVAIIATTISTLIALHEEASLLSLMVLLVILLVTSVTFWFINAKTKKAYRELKSSHAASSHASQLHIEFLAHHDPLTGLPTRSIARDRFEQMMLTAQRDNSSCLLLLIDLDNFKAVNDTAGHAAGDQFLQHSSRMLKHSVGPEVTVCRLGGDEFLILIQDLDVTGKIITNMMNRIIEDLKTPLVIDGFSLSASCSIGVAVFPGHGDTYDTILQNADSAMQQAKKAGRNGFCYFDPSLNSAVKNYHLITDLRNSILNEELVLHYQPQFDLRSGALVGAEALVRWNHPTEGLLPPSAFIHLAETSGFINELGIWVLREACMQCAEWRAAGTNLIMSINTSPMQFRRNFDVEVLTALEVSQLPPENLDMELTEGLFIEDTQDMSDTLWRIRQLGVLMSIDDFGTGYSTLSYLRRLPVQQVKIDQSFVRSLDGDNANLVRAIVQIAQNFNLGTIAEGIEDEITLNALLDLGCTRGQGYYWDRPLPLDRFTEKYVKRRQVRAATA